MSAIEATTVKCATLVDGTLRLTMDVEPAMAQAAFKLFGAPGRAVGIAALKDGKDSKVDTAVKEIMRERRPVSDAQREAAQANWTQLGMLCKTAVMWCNVPEFQEWIGAKDAEEAGMKIKRLCYIESRKELDTNHEAAEKFRSNVIGPYQKYMVARQHA